MLIRLALLIVMLSIWMCAGATVVRRPAPPPPFIEAPGAETPVALRQLHVDTEISGSMAQTTVRVVLHNPNRRQLEASLQFPLPEGAQVTAFALDIEGVLRAAVPVEKARGRAVFETITRGQVDPALLEVTQGNNYQLRVYPLPPRGTRTVEITYTQPMQRQGAHWLAALPSGFGKAQDLSVRVTVNGAATMPRAQGEDLRFARVGQSFEASLARSDAAMPARATVLVDAAPGPMVYREQRHGENWFLAEIPVSAQATARASPRVIGLLWDSSGSGARRDSAAELAELEHAFATLGTVEVRLVRLRDRPEAMQRFLIKGGDWNELRRALAATVYDGASALHDWQVQSDVDTYVLASDGLGNYGAARAPQLGAHQTLHVLDSADAADHVRLAALAQRGRGSVIRTGSAQPGALAQVLRADHARVERIDAAGAADVEIESHTTRAGMLRIAGRLLQPKAGLTVLMASGQRINVALPADAPDHPMAAGTWARLRLRTLDADYDVQRAEIGRIGRRFGIPTRETSLIVLDRMEDYLRFGLEPPASHAAQFAKLKATRGGEQRLARTKHIDEVVRMFEERTSWWNTRFPLAPPKTVSIMQDPPMVERREFAMEMALAAPAPAAAAPMRADSLGLRKSALASAASVGPLGPESAPTIGMALKKWVPNAPYIARLKAAPADKVYAVYLDLKPDYANSTAFFLDAADILLEKSQRDLALRVLSNLAEMDLENRAVLRILGYRLLQAGAPALAIPVFDKVLHLAEEEPQSWRDLGLALAAAGRNQEAIERLYEVVERPWDARFPGIETIALAELNAIVATARKPLDVSRIDPRLRANLPLDLRVIMTWDADNSDMDLWVTGPDGERCSYAQALTRMGGRMSRDFTGGYGPEEFSIRRAMPGKYRIEANYYGNRQQVVAGATTLQVKLFSAFGTAAQKEQSITLRLKDRAETVFVGEFEVKP